MQVILLRDGVLYFAVSVVVGITDIVFLEAVKSPVIASTVIPLHFALSSVMTTRLVNNVFRVIADGKGVHILPTVNSTSRDGTTKAPSLGIAPTRKVGQSTTTVGGGGTADLDALNTKGQSISNAEDYDSALNIPSQRGFNQSHTYAIPMQVRVTQDNSHIA